MTLKQKFSIRLHFTWLNTNDDSFRNNFLRSQYLSIMHVIEFIQEYAIVVRDRGVGGWFVTPIDGRSITKHQMMKKLRDR